MNNECINACRLKDLGDHSRSWNDIAELYGYSSGEALRSCWRRMKKNNTVENKNEGQEVDKIIEIKKERIKLQDQRTELNKQIRELARFEYMQEFAKTLAEEMKQLKPFEWKPVKGSGKTEGVLLFSDQHYGINIDNFLNKYNKEIFNQRINRLVMKTIEYGKFNNIKTLHMANLGDSISGVIHQSIRAANTEDVITQIQYIAEIIAEMLAKFANEFEIIKYYNVVDNHSRITANKKEEIPMENLARLIPWYLSPRLNNIKNIEIVENKLDLQMAQLNICGYNAIAVHGHLDNPKDVVANLSLMTKTNYDYIFMSHFHHLQEGENHSCEVIVNPSFVGVDDFAKDVRKTSKPAQRFMIFNKEDGRVATYNIRLDR